MKIENVRHTRVAGRPALMATIVWEDSDRSSQDIYVATTDEFGDYLSDDASSFAIACMPAAFHHQEKRLAVQGGICPELRDGLLTAMGFMQLWFEPEKPLVALEVKPLELPSRGNRPEREAFFMSGGIDSLASLRINHQYFPADHPRYFRDGILIYGNNVESDNRIETFERAVQSLSAVAADADIRLIPVYTNLRELDLSRDFFAYEFHGAIMGATAHALAGRITSASIAAGQNLKGLRMHLERDLIHTGSHPLIDPYFSSHDLEVRHVDLTYSRLDKIRLIADWDAALHAIKVCLFNYPGENCCRCEKCIRTMLGLEAVGALRRSRSFMDNDFTADHLVHVRAPQVIRFIRDEYYEMIHPLRERGRDDLALAVQQLILRSLQPPRNRKWPSRMKKALKKQFLY